jgi:hypothetical protein
LALAATGGLHDFTWRLAGTAGSSPILGKNNHAADACDRHRGRFVSTLAAAANLNLQPS